MPAKHKMEVYGARADERDRRQEAKDYVPAWIEERIDAGWEALIRERRWQS